MSKTLDRLLKSNGLFCVDYRTGSPRDIVGNLTPTVVGSPVMTQGQGVFVPDETIPHYVSYGNKHNLSDLTAPRSWVVGINSPRIAGAWDFLCKVDGSGASGWFISTNSTNWWCGINTASSSIAVGTNPGPDNVRDQYAVVTYSGSKAGSGFRLHLENGTSYVGSGVLPESNCNNAASLTIAGSAVTVWNKASRAVRLAAMFNRVITPQEAVTLMAELRRETPPGLLDAPKRHFSFPHRTLTPAQAAAQGLVLDTDFVRRSDGKVRNLAPTAYAGTLVGNPVPWTEGMVFDGVDDLLNFGDVTELNGASKVVVDWSMLAMETSITSGDVVWGKNVVANQRFNVEFANPTPSSSLFIRVEGGSPANATTPAGTFGSKRWTRFTLAFDGTQATNAERLRLFVEGAQVALTFAGSIPAALSNSVGSSFVLANDGLGSANKSNIAVRSLRIRAGVALTAAEVRAEYLEGARRLTLDGRLRSDGSCPVSLTAITTANTKVPGTIWTTRTALATYVEEVSIGYGPRCIRQAGGDNLIFANQPEAFGSWYLQCNSQQLQFFPIASVPENYHSVSKNGYMLYFDGNTVDLYKDTAGALAVLFSAPLGPTVLQKNVSFWLSRTPVGVFKLWYRLATDSAWSLVGTATDAIHTTSKFCTSRAIAGGVGVYRLGDFMHFAGAMTPAEAIGLGLINP